MLIEDLIKLYGVLVKENKLPKSGWVNQSIDCQINLSKDGKFVNLVNFRVQDNNRSNKIVPFCGVRSNNINPFLFCDNAKYFLYPIKPVKPENPTDKEKEEYEKAKKEYEKDKAKYEASKKVHISFLKNIDCEEAKAFVKFLTEENAIEFSEKIRAEISNSVINFYNFTYSVNNKLLIEVPAIQKAWDQMYANEKEKGQIGIDAITGEKCHLVDVHPKIRYHGKDSSLITFNAPSSISYSQDNKNKAMYFPMSYYNAVAYTSALNYLLSNKNYHVDNNKVTICCWTDNAEEKAPNLLMSALNNMKKKSSEWTQKELIAIINKIAHGQDIPDINIRHNDKIHVLVLTTDVSGYRIREQSYITNELETLTKSISKHYERLKLDTNLGFDLVIPTQEDWLNSVMLGYDYPVKMLNDSIKALKNDIIQAYRSSKHCCLNPDMIEHLAIYKAYCLKNLVDEKKKEVITVSLNEENRNPAYLIGRMIAITENAECKVSGTHHTLKCLTMAMSNPAFAFQAVSERFNRYIGKMNPTSAVYFQKQMQEIVDKLPDDFCVNRTPIKYIEKGEAPLGYYQQNTAIFKKSPNKTVDKAEKE